MKSISALLVLIAGIAGHSFTSTDATPKDNKMSLSWFKFKEPHVMNVHYEDPKLKKKRIIDLVINDPSVIKRFVEEISALPVNGDEMISMDMARTVHVTVTFGSAGQMDKIEFYNGMIKTPSTGFHSESPAPAKLLYADLLSILLPQYNKPTLKVLGLPVPFDLFKFIYTSNKVRKPEPGGPTLTFWDEIFTIEPLNGKPFELVSTSGQLPPKDIDFKVGTKKFTLITFQTKDKEPIRLNPKYFMIKK
jgi:hypothetical protein